MQSKSEIAAWLRLQLTPGIGNASTRRLLAAFSLPEYIFAQDYAALSQVVSAKQAQALQQEPPAYASAWAKLEAWLQQAEQFVINLADADYPQSLLLSPDPPLLLYVQCADRAWWQVWAAQAQAPLLGVIGSRNPTPQGLRVAKEWGQQLAQNGLSVVSGLALGVDAAAHQGALAAPPWRAGRSIAVVGTGLDVVYPKQHAALAQEILDAGGAIISEYPLGTPAVAANFPKRNRIIAGLGLGVLVVEAALQSGSLITARLAMEANREVFALPGSIYAPQYKGCHALIKQGAQLVETVADILDALPRVWEPAPEITMKSGAAQAGLTPESSKNIPKTQEGMTQIFQANMPASNRSRAVTSKPAEAASANPTLQAMGFDPIGLDALGLALSLSAAQLQVELLALELAGRIERLPGGFYQRLS